MRINVFDTPGFYDTDICQTRMNKMEIARQIDNEIDVFVYLMDSFNTKIDENIQNIFYQLNEWTMGQIWNNLLIVYPKISRSSNDQYENFVDGKSQMKSIETTFNEMKLFLSEISSQNKWNKTSFVDGQENQQRLSTHDFENIQFSTLNVKQNKYCKFDENGRVRQSSRACWKMPEYDDQQDYLSYDDYMIYNNDRWILIEEVRKFQNIVYNFMTHPVTSEKEIRRQELKKDLNKYLQRQSLLQEFDNKLKLTKRNELQSISDCSSIFAETRKNISNINCPYWGEWINSDCSQTCGTGTRIVSRSCFRANISISASDCEKEFPDLEKTSERTEPCINQRCVFVWSPWTNGPCSTFKLQNCGTIFK